jgi:hypothetical protein
LTALALAESNVDFDEIEQELEIEVKLLYQISFNEFRWILNGVLNKKDCNLSVVLGVKLNNCWEK